MPVSRGPGSRGPCGERTVCLRSFVGIRSRFLRGPQVPHHLAPEILRSGLRRLATMAKDSRVLIVATFRESFDTDNDWSARKGMEVLALGRLDPDAATELVARIVRGRVHSPRATPHGSRE